MAGFSPQGFYKAEVKVLTGLCVGAGGVLCPQGSPLPSLPPDTDENKSTKT